MTCIAILKTRCGAERTMRVKNFLPRIHVPLIEDLTPLSFSGKIDPRQLVPRMRNRVFEYRHRTGPETAEYLEMLSHDEP